MADRISLFSLRGQMARPRAARRGDRDRTLAGCDRCPGEPMAESLLQCASGQELGQLRPRDRHLLHSGELLHRARGLPALSPTVASDPLAALADLALSRRMA